MKLDILYYFLIGLDILVHDFQHVFLQLIQLMPKHIIYNTVCLVSGDLKLVIASWCQCFWLSAVHWLFEIAFIFDCCQFTVSIVLCHMEASSGGMFTVPSACGYPHYCLFSQFVYDSVSYYLGYMICSDILLMISINGSGVLLTSHCPISFFLLSSSKPSIVLPFLLF